MISRARFIAVCLIAVSLPAAYAADLGVTTETSTGPGGVLVRSVAPGAVGKPNAPAFGVSGTDQTALWMDDHPTSIANDVAISGFGHVIMTGWYLNYMRTSKYATEGNGTPEWEYPEAVNFYLPVSLSDAEHVMASAGSQAPMNVWLNYTGPTPSWSYSLPTGYNNNVDVNVSDGGEYIALVCKQDGTGTGGKLFVFAADNPTPTCTRWRRSSSTSPVPTIARPWWA